MKKISKTIIVCVALLFVSYYTKVLFVSYYTKAQDFSNYTVSEFAQLTNSTLPADMGFGTIVKCEYTDGKLTYYVEDVDNDIFEDIGKGAKERLSQNNSFRKIIYPILKKENASICYQYKSKNGKITMACFTPEDMDEIINTNIEPKQLLLQEVEILQEKMPFKDDEFSTFINVGYVNGYFYYIIEIDEDSVSLEDVANASEAIKQTILNNLTHNIVSKSFVHMLAADNATLLYRYVGSKTENYYDLEIDKTFIKLINTCFETSESSPTKIRNFSFTQAEIKDKELCLKPDALTSLLIKKEALIDAIKKDTVWYQYVNAITDENWKITLTNNITLSFLDLSTIIYDLDDITISREKLNNVINSLNENYPEPPGSDDVLLQKFIIEDDIVDSPIIIDEEKIDFSSLTPETVKSDILANDSDNWLRAIIAKSGYGYARTVIASKSGKKFRVIIQNSELIDILSK